MAAMDTDSRGLKFLKLAEYCKANNYKLAPSHKELYFDLLDLIELEGVFDQKRQLYYLQMTLNDFANRMQTITPKYIHTGLHVLSNCGLIDYANSDVKTNRTYLLLDVTKIKTESTTKI